MDNESHLASSNDLQQNDSVPGSVNDMGTLFSSDLGNQTQVPVW